MSNIFLHVCGTNMETPGFLCHTAPVFAPMSTCIILVFIQCYSVAAVRARANGEKQNLKIKPKTNEQTSGFSGKMRMEYKCRIRVTNKNLKSKTKTSRWSRGSTSTDAPSSCGRGGAQP